MILNSVSSSLRPVRRRTRTLSSLLTAAALTLPAFGSARAQAPGSVDTGFAPTTVAATIYALLFEQNPNPSALRGNTVLAAGDAGFLETNLQPDGREKGSFIEPLYGAQNRIVFTAVQERLANPGTADGFQKILIGGLLGQSIFQQLQKVPAQNIVRILDDGTQDTSFLPGTSSNGLVTSLLPLTNGTIVAGGQFTTFNGESRLRIVRLQNNGLVDESFNSSSVIDNDVLALAEGVVPFASYPGGALRPDGTILVGGTFNHVGGLPITKLARLDASGTVDATFHPAINERVNAIVVQPTGKIIIGGQFTSVNGQPALGLARLNRDGSLDTTFTANVSGLPAGEVNPVAVYVLQQTSSKGGFKVYVGGNFTLLNGLTRRYIGLLDGNGAVVQAFDPGTAIYDKVQSIGIQPNGRVLVGETLGPKIGKNFVPTYLRLFGGTVSN